LIQIKLLTLAEGRRLSAGDLAQHRHALDLAKIWLPKHEVLHKELRKNCRILISVFHSMLR
jgi:hypothetical protein